MEGLAKTAEQVKNIITNSSSQNEKDPFAMMQFDSVPMSVYMYFDKTFGGESDEVQKQLKTVFEFSKSLSKDESIGGIMLKLKEIDRNLGAPKIGETRLSRVFNYAKLTGMMNNLEKQRRAITGF